jgi:hypothetical protein
MLVRARDGAIQKHFFKVRILGQFRKYRLQNRVVRPAREALVHAIPKPEFGRQIAPRAAGARDPQHCLNKLSVVLARTSRVTGFTGQHRLKTLPLVITQPLTNHPDPPQISGCKQISSKDNSPQP